MDFMRLLKSPDWADFMGSLGLTSVVLKVPSGAPRAFVRPAQVPAEAPATLAPKAHATAHAA